MEGLPKESTGLLGGKNGDLHSFRLRFQLVFCIQSSQLRPDARGQEKGFKMRSSTNEGKESVLET